MERSKETAKGRRAWAAFAALVFALATADRLAAVFERDPRASIPSRATLGTTRFWVKSDQQFVVWAVARNARTLATRPLDLFEAEQCYPDRASLALGEPVVAMGLLGVPAWLATHDPVLTYNVVVALMSIFAALAMYLLIVAWTGVPAAGVVAGLLYAFHGLATHDPVHPYSADTTWAVLAMWFATRWLADGRWRDACGVAAAAAVQIATSFYPLVAVSLVALPFAAWLGFRYGLRAVRPAQVALVVAVALAAALVVLGPYVANRNAGVLSDRTAQHFRAWSDYLPGGLAFFGWWPSALAIAGALAPARLFPPTSRGVRIALVVGGLAVAAVAAGPGGVPTPFGSVDVYRALAAVAPGFDAVRIPMKIAIGVHLVACILAGFGAAAVVAAVPRLAPGLSPNARVALGGGVAIAALAAVTWGPTRANATTLAIRPPDEALEFFDGLAARGNGGPIFETPVPEGDDGLLWSGTAPQLLLAAYHHRPTSACYPSYPPPSRAALESIERRLPERAAVDELRALGFTTIVLRHAPTRGAKPRRRSPRSDAFQRAARGERAALSLVYETPWASAYEIAR